jgi:pyridoxal/pyridoxine/pyridoxamine kinase
MTTNDVNCDEVICPQCCHQFRAIPVNVQRELAASQRDVKRLRQWQREMVEKAASGGVLDGYRELAEKCAAHEETIDALRKNAERLRSALELVMGYPDVRIYLGSEISNIADAAINAAKGKP